MRGVDLITRLAGDFVRNKDRQVVILMGGKEHQIERIATTTHLLILIVEQEDEPDTGDSEDKTNELFERLDQVTKKYIQALREQTKLIHAIKQ